MGQLRHSRNVGRSLVGLVWGSNGAPSAVSSSGPLFEEDLDHQRDGIVTRCRKLRAEREDRGLG